MPRKAQAAVLSSSGLIIPQELGAFISQTESPGKHRLLAGTPQPPSAATASRHRVALRGRCRARLPSGTTRFPQERWVRQDMASVHGTQPPVPHLTRLVSKTKNPQQNSIRKHSTQQQLFKLSVQTCVSAPVVAVT